MAVAASEPDLHTPRENTARILWAFAWPAVALNSLQVVNTLLDRFFIGHLPQAALTAQGASLNVMFLLFSLAMAISTGATAIVSRAYGAGEKSEYREAARQAARLAVVSGAVLAFVGVLATPLLGQLVLPPGAADARRLMFQFLSVYAIGLPAIYLIQVLAGAMRGVGDTRSPMWISGIQIGLHMLLNSVLIFPARDVLGIRIPGADLGLTGAAIALAASAWIAAIIYVAYARKTPLGSVLSFRLPSLHWVQRILKIAVPNAAMAVLRVGSLMAFTMILAATPSAETAIAAMSIAFAVESIMFMPPFGLSMAASALVGQSLGMKKPERAERFGWVAGHHGALVVLAVVLPVFLFAKPIASTMVASEHKPATMATASQQREIEMKEATATEASNLIRWLCATEIFFSYAMIMIGAMQGAGDTVRPFWITVVCLWLLRVPLAWILAVGFRMGADGAWISMSFSQAIQGLLAIWYFRRGAWKTIRV